MGKPVHDSYSKRAEAAYTRRWGAKYEPDLDDTGWWKWLIAWDTGYRAGLREAKRRAVGKSE